MPRRSKNPKLITSEVNFSDEQLFTPPKNPDGLLMEDYLNDKYTMYYASKETFEKIKANNYNCLTNPECKCMCHAWKYLDAEGICPCGVYKKVLNDIETFRKKRSATLSGPKFKK